MHPADPSDDEEELEDADISYDITIDGVEYNCAWENGDCSKADCIESGFEDNEIRFAPDYCNHFFGEYLHANHCDPSGNQKNGCNWRCCTPTVDTEQSINGGCPDGYSPMSADCPGWGRIDGIGKGQTLGLTACAEACTSKSACTGFEVSQSTEECNLNTCTIDELEDGMYRDFLLCQKN